MIKFIGDFKDLEALGFGCDLNKTYYFLTKMDIGHSLFIDTKTREIECSFVTDLQILEGLYIEEDTDSNI